MPTMYVELLGRGGVRLPAPGGEPDDTAPPPGPFQVFADPSAADELGRRLAAAAAEMCATQVLVWDNPCDRVLGYVVARELGVAVACAVDIDGLMLLEGELVSEAQLLVVTERVRGAAWIKALDGLARQRGGTVAGIVSAIPQAGQWPAGHEPDVVVGDGASLLAKADRTARAREHKGSAGVRTAGRGGVQHADQNRLAKCLDEIAAITDGEVGEGCTRLAYTERERQAHDLVKGWFSELGLKVWTDEAGNTIAERPGRRNGAAVATGSHLDTVPGGGRFDGVVGVVAAVEVARLLAQGGVEHDHPFRFVVFAAEEGARFGQACIGSKAVAHEWTPGALEQLRDQAGTSAAAAMRSVGLNPAEVAKAAWSSPEWGAFLELHIEQGQVLESRGVGIGTVDLISGSTRLEMDLRGRASHSGGTPMHLRSDAVAAASEIVLLAEEIANDSRHRGTRCTVGRLRVEPGSITTIPGRTVLSVDVRDVDSDRQRATANEIVTRSAQVCARRRVTFNWRPLSDTSPVVLPVWLRDVVGRVCTSMGVAHCVLPSGASHDAQLVNQRAPAGLIFVPCREGLSHVATEWASAADIALGIDVLLGALLELDLVLGEVSPSETEAGDLMLAEGTR